MAERPTEFSYRDIELLKSESLGSGSYGGVCKAKCDGLLCAAKIMHPTLFDIRDPGTATYLRKFREECHLLSLARHPNVVQYLATSQDPDTQLPVLLMELCEESLTGFLEQSPGPLPYHIQVNICHNVVLGLVYLHSNGVIHRDLTGNNVLMVAGPRAKITDFGMSKLARGNARMTALTLCPGNLLYMSPEALDEAKSYTAKLDIFSFGVIVIQILTRLFPNPTNRFRTVHSKNIEEETDDEEEEVRQLVPETQRRQAHLQLIPDTHSLKPIVLQCLKKRERHRPSAVELSVTLSELKQSPQYRESVSGAHMSDDVQQLQLQLRGQRVLTDAKTRETEELHMRVTELERTVKEKDRQLQEHQLAIQSIDEQLQAKTGNCMKEMKLHEIVVHTSELELQQNLQQKEKTISDLQQTISAQERKIQQLELERDIYASASCKSSQSLSLRRGNGGRGRMHLKQWLGEQLWYMETQPISEHGNHTRYTHTSSI